MRLRLQTDRVAPRYGYEGGGLHLKQIGAILAGDLSGAKARLLLTLGYRQDAPGILDADLRAQHLSLDAMRKSTNSYGVVYEIDGPITTPSGRVVRFCSIWQVDTGSEVPRFVTMYPR